MNVLRPCQGCGNAILVDEHRPVPFCPTCAGRFNYVPPGPTQEDFDQEKAANAVFFGFFAIIAVIIAVVLFLPLIIAALVFLIPVAVIVMIVASLSQNKNNDGSS